MVENIGANHMYRTHSISFILIHSKKSMSLFIKKGDRQLKIEKNYKVLENKV